MFILKPNIIPESLPENSELISGNFIRLKKNRF